ncbi:uncharacterized protein BDZ99DRAFT_527372 [Mytilinidion resinicola]|uniref:Uncharacterized protein n=1 Tax=Mytilinidion resinicola TaxID=574789 RepID=A0A6A6Y1W7_9PEZI|nr:uncharacterized protein BDZ99DRAFT_527372 [Mytilinidion resinicola]KAF2802650.1 hypothetical protein BDZ99DRAFT_527372 [Mytilinidion resinicola]
MPPYNLRRSPEKSRKLKEADEKTTEASTQKSARFVRKASISSISTVSDQPPKAPNFQTLEMLGQMQPSREPRARDFTGFREVVRSQDVDDTAQGVENTTATDEDDSYATVLEAQGPSAGNEKRRATNPNISFMDIDRTDFSMVDADASTPRRKIDSPAIEATAANDDEEDQSISLGQLTLSDTECGLHCSDEEAARLHAEAPDAALVQRHSILEDLERLYEKQLIKAANDVGYKPSLNQTATDQLRYLESMKYQDLELRGLDPNFVEDQLKWAKWAAKAADAGLFHRPDERCGSLREQVERACASESEERQRTDFPR